MADAKAVFLVDDDEAEIVERDIALQQAMRADHDVDRARLEPRNDGLLLGSRAEAREVFDAHGPVREPVRKGLGVLLREQGRRHQHRDLPPAGDGGEAGAKGDLGLAEADIAANDAVHRAPRAHVGEDGLDRVVLVDGLLEGKRRLEGAVGGLVKAEGTALAGRAPRIEIEQLRRDVADTVGGATPRARPLLRAEAMPGGRVRRAARVPRHAIERMHRDVDEVAARVLDDEELRRIAGDLHHFQPAVAPDAVFLVHDRGTGRQRRQFAQDRFGIAIGATSAPLLSRPLAEELCLGDQGDRLGGQPQAPDIRRGGDGEWCIARQERVPVRRGGRGKALAPQHFEEDFPAAGRIGGDQHARRGLREEMREFFERQGGPRVATELRRWLGREIDVRQAGGDRFHLDRREQDPRMRCQGLQRIPGRHENLGWREQRPLAIVRPLVMTSLDLRPVGRQGALEDRRGPRSLPAAADSP